MGVKHLGQFPLLPSCLTMIGLPEDSSLFHVQLARRNCSSSEMYKCGQLLLEEVAASKAY